MDSIFEKFSIFDFFNLIFTGFVFLAGLQLLGISIEELLRFNLSDNNLYWLILLALCYMIGSIFQFITIHSGEDKKAFKTCLNNKKLMKNELRRKNYIRNANKYLKISPDDNETFTEDQCELFYVHCLYYIQIRSKHKKTEKLRDLYGVSSMLSVCFLFLSMAAAVITYNELKREYFLLTILYIALTVMFFLAMRRNLYNRVNMVLGIYDACIEDQDSINTDNGTADNN